ncbi:MAG: intradiol ring-cleavage dioxygenase [Planctomycetia bacterium]|jgi:protocatechuate 3,4-dioxygenase, beta subunit
MFHRRSFLEAAAFGTACWTIPGVFAEELVRTPSQTEGPFYPDKLPLDTDNDLIIINNKITPAVGTITHLTGKVFDSKGNPVRNALVEIWQCDANGAYLHTRTGNKAKQDANFQGFGKFLTSSTGEYYFRTIKPVPYPGRTPHIHFKVRHEGKDVLTTQCYIKGEERNEKDGIYRGIRDAKQRDSVTVDFNPMKNSKLGELAANFNIVLGITPEMPG